MLSWLAFLSADHPLGISTAFETTAARILQGGADPERGAGGFFGDHAPRIGWEWMLVLGVFLGSFASAALSGDRQPGVVPSLWQARFGPGRAKRLVVALLGGVVMIFGARLAGGCTSGHGISGNLQLAVSSLLFTAAFFASGVATAKTLYGSGRSLDA